MKPLVVLVALAISLAAGSAAGSGEVHRDFTNPDPWGVDLAKICSLDQSVPPTEECIAFVSAVVESEIGEEAVSPPNSARRFCPPRNFSVRQITRGILPELRKRYGYCAGLCTAESAVRSSLYAAFPCGP